MATMPAIYKNMQLSSFSDAFRQAISHRFTINVKSFDMWAVCDIENVYRSLLVLHCVATNNCICSLVCQHVNMMSNYFNIKSDCTECMFVTSKHSIILWLIAFINCSSQTHNSPRKRHDLFDLDADSLASEIAGGSERCSELHFCWKEQQKSVIKYNLSFCKCLHSTHSAALHMHNLLVLIRWLND